MAALIQRELELPEVPALDLNAACSGFIYALEVARGLLSAGLNVYDIYPDKKGDNNSSSAASQKCALVIGTEQLSRLLSMEDRTTAILFGDGAGAAVVALDSKEENSMYVSLLGSRGSGAIEAPSVYTGAYEQSIRKNTMEEGQEKARIDHMLMDGKDVFVFACDIIPRIINGLLCKTGLSLEDVDHIVCHQANARIIRHVIRAMHAPAEKFFMNMETLGNISAASIPIALYDMKNKGLLHEGDRMILAGFGGGLTWGGCVINYR
jgi:3-oxoacyl-[acyl-carrier-protein] synthase-3